MHITHESDYAIRIVKTLALKNTRVDAKTIAEITGVTLRFSLKILRKLVMANIAKSYKGTQGGYVLARDPSQITLRNVIEAIEGDYALSRCLNNSEYCNNPQHADSGTCQFKSAFCKISNMVKEELDKVNFA